MKTPRDFARAMEARLKAHEGEVRPQDFTERSLPDLWDEMNNQWGNRIFDARIQIKNGDIDAALKNIEHIGTYLYFVWNAMQNTELTDSVKSDINEVNVIQTG